MTANRGSQKERKQPRGARRHSWSGWENKAALLEVTHVSDMTEEVNTHEGAQEDLWPPKSGISSVLSQGWW